MLAPGYPLAVQAGEVTSIPADQYPAGVGGKTEVVRVWAAPHPNLG